MGAAAKESSEIVLGPSVKVECIPVSDPVLNASEVEVGPGQEVIGHAPPRKGADSLARQALPLKPPPRPGGIHGFEMTAALEFSREFEVVKDAEDGLENTHSRTARGQVEDSKREPISADRGVRLPAGASF